MRRYCLLRWKSAGDGDGYCGDDRPDLGGSIQGKTIEKIVDASKFPRMWFAKV